MKSAEIRSSFVDFFADHGHRAVPSSPLVPHGDATLLFTNAGMVQFKDYFTGAATPEFRRAVTVQKCLRVSGKHNDLENVGPSPRHHTFFEMLGNFSFGDYFKAEAIEWGWDLVTRVWGLPKEHLFASVFRGDDEAFELWRRISGLPAARIQRCGEKDNFWAMGETGPCGPCSEIFVDRRPGEPQVDWDEGTESGRYLEIWNLVFMQFERNRGDDGTIVATPLPTPSIDTGAGLERVAAALAGVDSNYDTDLFRPILEATATLAATRYGREPQADVSMRVVADHLRAVAFLLADGVMPSNEGRGYVLRRLLRRAVRHGMRLGFAEPFLCRLLPVVDEAMAGAYAELAATRTASEATVRTEEEKFLSTLATGSQKEQELIEERRARGVSTLEGPVVFMLKDTLGMPVEVIREIAEEEKFTIDETGYEAALSEQRERSRAAGSRDQIRGRQLQEYVRVHFPNLPPTRFEGYQNLSVEQGSVLAVARWAQGQFGEGVERPEKLGVGDEAALVFDVTPFYAEAGGQVGDVGVVRWAGGEAEVLDTQKDTAGIVYHFVRVVNGALSEPFPSMELLVSLSHRQAALQETLGSGVRQAGSLVHPDYLRFDFTFGRPLTDDERTSIERRVNEWVLAATPVEIVADRPIDEARAAGAMALFGEKYGERVRTVGVPGVSLELCGGCHVRNTGEIGPFVVTAERGVASGVRRIEAKSGEGALGLLRSRDEELRQVEALLGAEAGRSGVEIERLRHELKERDRELARLRHELVTGGTAADGAEELEVAGVRLLVREVPAAPPGELRGLADELRAKLGSGVVVLGTRAEGKVSLVASVSEDVRARVPAGRLVKAIAALVGGSGGGRDDFAQAGGKQPEELPAALARVPELVASLAAGG